MKNSPFLIKEWPDGWAVIMQENLLPEITGKNSMTIPARWCNDGFILFTTLESETAQHFLDRLNNALEFWLESNDERA